MLRFCNVMFDLKSLRTQATYVELKELSSSTNLFKGPLFSIRKQLHRVEQCRVNERVESLEEEDVFFVRDALAGHHAEHRRVN